MASNIPVNVDAVRIVDIRGEPVPGGSSSSLRDQVLHGLAQPVGHKTLPSLLLYDERGLRLYDELTTRAAEYYLFPAEEEILKNKADEIVRRIMQSGVADPDGDPVDAFVVELGAGALRKTSLILSAFARFVPHSSPTPPINYLALDLERRELESTLVELNASEVGAQLKGKVATAGLCGTYDDGLKFLKEGGLEARTAFEGAHRAPSFSYKCPELGGLGRVGKAASFSSAAASSASNASRRNPTTGSEASDATRHAPPPPPLHILFIGSSLGNFARGDDAAFLRSLPLRPGSGDTLLLGIDHGHDAQQIEAAYNDPKGISEKFAMNGLTSAGRALGDEGLFDESKWQYVGMYNGELRRHEAYYKSTCDQTVVDPRTKAHLCFAKDELVRVAVSHKFSKSDTCKLFADANLHPVQRWTNSSSQYALWLLQRPKFSDLVERERVDISPSEVANSIHGECLALFGYS